MKDDELKEDFLKIKNCNSEDNNFSELHSKNTENKDIETNTEVKLAFASMTEPQLDAFSLSISQLQKTKRVLEEAQYRLQDYKGEIRNLQIQLKETKQVIIAMESSLFWKLRLKWFKLRNIFGLKNNNLPIIVGFLLHIKQIFSSLSRQKTLDIKSEIDNTKTDDVYVNIKIKPEIPLSDDINYQKWLQLNYPTSATLKRLAETLEIFPYKPVITLILLLCNTSENYLHKTIASLVNQIYPYWQLHIIYSTSVESQITEILNEYAAKDSRINLNRIGEESLNIFAYNSIFNVAAGEFIGLLHNNDLLAPDAFYEIALLLNKHPEADMVYSDEDKIDDSERLKEPFFKPDWCPDSFLSRMYTSNLAVYRCDLIKSIGGFRAEYENCYEYDLILRLTEKTQNIFHIPKILYHSRINNSIIPSKIRTHQYNIQQQKQALLDAINRREELANVIENNHLLGSFIMRYKIIHKKLVSIIIPTRDLGEILDKCLTSIFDKTTYSNYEVIVIDNGSKEDYTAKVISKWQKKEVDKFRCYQLDIPFNYSKINNYGVSLAKGDYLLFLNNDIEIITHDWIDAMVEQCQRVSIGAVGGLLLYPDNTIQHAGVVMGIGGVAGHSHQYFSSNSPGYFGQIMTINNYSAITAACLMCRREVFESVGGFEEELTVAFNDVDLCLKMLEKDYKNIYLPHVVLYHYESKSRGAEDTPEKITRFNQEVKYMLNKWEEYIYFDPCYNPHLTKLKQDYSIKF